jgi:hypothetical protein
MPEVDAPTKDRVVAYQEFGDLSAMQAEVRSQELGVTGVAESISRPIEEFGPEFSSFYPSVRC